jgi:hypothetical protein
MNLRRYQKSLRLLAVFVLALTFVTSGAVLVWAETPDAAATVTPVTGVTSTPKGDDMVEPAIMDDSTSPSPSATPVTTKPEVSSVVGGNLITNGSFEDGFSEGIGLGWEGFASVSVQAGWEDDTWADVVYDGEHAQLMALKDAWEPDRYVGVFQTVNLVPGTDYLLTLHGVIRSDAGSIAESDYGYRMHYGIDAQGGTNWQSDDITWVELPWDEQPRMGPITRIDSYSATIKAETGKATLFIRGMKKWPVAGEGNYDIDGISLVAAAPGVAAAPTATQAVIATPVPTEIVAAATPQPEMPETGTPVLGNENVLLAVNIAILVLLIGGVTWKLSRPRRV